MLRRLLLFTLLCLSPSAFAASKHGYLKVSAGTCSIRKGADDKSAPDVTARKGQVYTLLEDEPVNGYYKVDCSGHTSYIRAEDVQRLDDQGTPVPTRVPTKAVKPAKGKGEDRNGDNDEDGSEDEEAGPKVSPTPQPKATVKPTLRPTPKPMGHDGEGGGDGKDRDDEGDDDGHDKRTPTVKATPKGGDDQEHDDEGDDEGHGKRTPTVKPTPKGGDDHDHDDEGDDEHAKATPTVRPTVKPTLKPTEASHEHDDEGDDDGHDKRTPTVKPTPKGGDDHEHEHDDEGDDEHKRTPTVVPTKQPTRVPTVEPTEEPTDEPTLRPTRVPTPIPTRLPTLEPTDEPTAIPTHIPTRVPTLEPTDEPTVRPTVIPTPIPTRVPTLEPTEEPTVRPTPIPTRVQTLEPTDEPTHSTGSGQAQPTAIPTERPWPTAIPTRPWPAPVPAKPWPPPIPTKPWPTPVPTRPWPTAIPTERPLPTAVPVPTGPVKARGRRNARAGGTQTTTTQRRSSRVDLGSTLEFGGKFASAVRIERPAGKLNDVELHLPLGWSKHETLVQPPFKQTAATNDQRPIEFGGFTGLGLELRTARWLRWDFDWLAYSHRTKAADLNILAFKVNVPGLPATTLFDESEAYYRMNTHELRLGIKASAPLGSVVEPWVSASYGAWIWSAELSDLNRAITYGEDSGVAFGGSVGLGVDFHGAFSNGLGWTVTPFVEWGAPQVNPQFKDVAGLGVDWKDDFGTPVAIPARAGIQFGIGF